jgi:hypothetical protein
VWAEWYASQTNLHRAVKWFGVFAWTNNKEKKAGGFNKIALRWPTNAFDTPEAIQIAEAD